MLYVKLLYSALLHLPPLRFHCADGCWDRPFHLVHWQSDALTTRLDLLRTRLDLIGIRLDLIRSRLDLIRSRLDLIRTRLYLNRNMLKHIIHIQEINTPKHRSNTHKDR